MDAQQVVVLIHGIRTHASWAELVRSRLNNAGIETVVPIKYGYFDVFRFISPFWTRAQPIKRILRELRDIRRNHPNAKISVIAHSFGTYALVKALAELDIYVDKVIFCGSIVPKSFRRASLTSQLGISPIVNDCGTNDIWPVLAESITWGYGSTGTFGFGTYGVIDRYHPFSHGTYFSKEFVDTYWVPFLTEGKIVSDEWESDRPPAPWWVSALTAFHLKYALFAAFFAAAAYLTYVFLEQSRREEAAVPPTENPIDNQATAANPEKEPDEYTKDSIALVYQEANEFRKFLEKNAGKEVQINSEIALDDVLPINHLVHQLCEFNGPDETAQDNTPTPRSFSFGLPEFEANFDESDLDALVFDEELGGYDIPKQILDQVKCLDTIRIEPIEPASFRWSYGGTGTRSLPLIGTFRVTRRFFSGPSVEYTLRQVEE